MRNNYSPNRAFESQLEFSGQVFFSKKWQIFHINFIIDYCAMIFAQLMMYSTVKHISLEKLLLSTVQEHLILRFKKIISIYSHGGRLLC